MGAGTTATPCVLGGTPKDPLVAAEVVFTDRGYLVQRHVASPLSLSYLDVKILGL